MKPKDGPDARISPRYEAKIDVMVFTDGLEHFESEKTANVSLTGLFVVSKYKTEIGKRHHIRIVLKDLDSYFDLKAKVAWLSDGSGPHPQGFGLQFVELTKEHEHIIRTVLKNYVGETQSGA